MLLIVTVLQGKTTSSQNGIACRFQCLSLGYLGQLVARPEGVIHGGEPPKDSGPQILQGTSIPCAQSCSLLRVRLLLSPIGLKYTSGQMTEQASHCHFHPLAMCQVLCKCCSCISLCLRTHLSRCSCFPGRGSRGNQVTWSQDLHSDPKAYALTAYGAQP